MDMRFSLSNIWSVEGFSICHVSVNSYNIEKLEIVVEDITRAPPFARSCPGTRTEASGGAGSGPGTHPQSGLVYYPAMGICSSHHSHLPCPTGGGAGSLAWHLLVHGAEGMKRSY